MKKLLLSLTVLAGLSANSQVYYNASASADFLLGGVQEIDGDTNNWNVLDLSLQTSWSLPTALSDMGEVLFSESWNGNDLTPDNIYFTPRIDLTSATGTLNLTFKATSPDPTSDNFYFENYSVYVFDGYTNAVAAFAAAPAFTEVLPAGQTIYTHTVNVSSFAGADSLIVAFRHHACTGQWMVCLDDINVSGTNGINENVITASVYPNPAKDVINFEVAGDITTVEITTLDGKSVISSTDKTVSVADLKTGLYLYTLTTSNGKIAKGNFSKN